MNAPRKISVVDMVNAWMGGAWMGATTGVCVCLAGQQRTIVQVTIFKNKV